MRMNNLMNNEQYGEMNEQDFRLNEELTEIENETTSTPLQDNILQNIPLDFVELLESFEQFGEDEQDSKRKENTCLFEENSSIPFTETCNIKEEVLDIPYEYMEEFENFSEEIHECGSQVDEEQTELNVNKFTPHIATYYPQQETLDHEYSNRFESSEKIIENDFHFHNELMNFADNKSLPHKENLNIEGEVLGVPFEHPKFKQSEYIRESINTYDSQIKEHQVHLSVELESVDMNDINMEQDGSIGQAEVSKDDNGSNSPEGFPCKNCLSTFKSITQLREHSRSCRKITYPYHCFLCLSSFSSEKSLDLHKKTHMIDGKFSCPSCSKVNCTHNELIDHIFKEHRDEKMFKCHECGKRFATAKSLKCHQRFHDSEYMSCVTCTQTFFSRWHHNVHAYRCQQRKRGLWSTCSICGKKFTTEESFSVHIQCCNSTEVLEPFSYKKFDGKFNSTPRVGQHIQVNNEVKSKTCPICGMRFNKPYDLKTHLRMHNVTGNISCTTCFRKFENPADLRQHMWTHNTNRSNMCSICGLVFKRKSHLTQHMHKHASSGTVALHCCVCWRVFADKSTLLSHMREHDEVNAYTCFRCGIICTTPEKLVTHMSVHEATISSTCYMCGESFCTDESLIIHIKNHYVARGTSNHDVNAPLSDQFNCLNCSRVFDNIIHLKYHSKYCHSNMPLQCPSCKRRFFTTRGCEVHKRNMSCSVTYVCNACKQSFASSRDYLTHMSTHGEKNITLDKCSVVLRTSEAQQSWDNSMSEASNLSSVSGNELGEVLNRSSKSFSTNLSTNVNVNNEEKLCSRRTEILSGINSDTSYELPRTNLPRDCSVNEIIYVSDDNNSDTEDTYQLISNSTNISSNVLSKNAGSSINNSTSDSIVPNENTGRNMSIFFDRRNVVSSKHSKSTPNNFPGNSLKMFRDNSGKHLERHPYENNSILYRTNNGRIFHNHTVNGSMAFSKNDGNKVHPSSGMNSIIHNNLSANGSLVVDKNTEKIANSFSGTNSIFSNNHSRGYPNSIPFQKNSGRHRDNSNEKPSIVLSKNSGIILDDTSGRNSIHFEKTSGGSRWKVTSGILTENLKASIYRRGAVRHILVHPTEDIGLSKNQYEYNVGPEIITEMSSNFLVHKLDCNLPVPLSRDADTIYYKCMVCNVNNITFKTVKDHMITSKSCGLAMFMCTHCDIRYFTAAKLEEHSREHEKTYPEWLRGILEKNKMK